MKPRSPNLPGSRTALASILLAAMLTACVDDGTARHAVTMRTPAADALAKTLGTVTPAAQAWPSADWIAAFGDPQLIALVNETVANSPDIDVANSRVASAQAQLETFD